MKPMAYLRPAARAGFALLLSTLALGAAPKEQWLTYETMREGAGYRWLELETNAPPGVNLPRISGQAYFARWPTPMDPSGQRWICVVRGKSGANQVIVDANGNGRLDDDTAVSSDRSAEIGGSFGPMKMLFKGEDGPIAYHLGLRFYAFDEEAPRLLAFSGGFYTGTVDFGGKKLKVTLHDANANGAFNDTGAILSDADQLVIAKERVAPRHIGRLLEIEGEFFELEVARDGAFIKVARAGDLRFGLVEVPTMVGEFTAYGPTGHFTRKPDSKGIFKLPVGDYHMEEWRIDRKDARQANWQMSGYNFPKEARFKVGEGERTAVAIGEPVRAELGCEYAKQRPGKRGDRAPEIVFSLGFKGTAGETISFIRDSERPPGPKLELANADRSLSVTNTFEFG